LFAGPAAFGFPLDPELFIAGPKTESQAESGTVLLLCCCADCPMSDSSISDILQAGLNKKKGSGPGPLHNPVVGDDIIISVIRDVLGTEIQFRGMLLAVASLLYF
jgi:hypothetical protein